MSDFRPHPKAGKRPKKPGAMRTKPKVGKSAKRVIDGLREAVEMEKAREVPASQPTPPTGTKTDLIITMLSTPAGATSKQLEAATGWAPHSVRGLLGMLRKKGTTVISTKLPKEPTVYRIAPKPDDVGDVV